MSEINVNNDGQQLSLGVVLTIINDVVKRWYLIVVAALMAGMLAFMLVDFSYKPMYKTTATFVVSSGSATSTTYTNISSANNAATVFTEVLNSSILRKKVLEEMGISHFDGNISASVAYETNLLVMTVTGSDPRRVFLMAKGVIQHHNVVSEKALLGTVIELLDAPEAPVRPINTPNMVLSVAKASILAGCAVAGILMVLAYLSDKIRSRGEADAKLTAHVLGEIFHEKKNKTLLSGFGKKKKSILITNPLTSFMYTEAVNKLASRVEKHLHRGEKVIMVSSVLENEGKSTVASNLAISMASKGKKVLLIDCDLRKPSCNLIFDVQKVTTGIADLLKGKASLDEAVQHIQNADIYLLPGRKSIKNTSELLNSEKMESLLKEAKEKYDMVIVDVPPMSVAADAESISEHVDSALLVVRQNAATADRLNEASAVLGKTCHLLGCVLNNVYGAGNFAPVYGSYYGRYGKYGKYGRYGKYGYGRYGYGHHKSDNEVDA